LLALLLAAFAAASRWERRPLARNLVLVLVDTLRADHLSLYGYARGTSPVLDRLARERGIVFENVRSQAPCTFPSVNSLLTSRSPLTFVRRGEGQFSIPPQVPTLALVLAASGYSSVAVSASPVVRDTPSKENPTGGFGAGFDRFDEHCYWQGAPCVNGRAVQALEGLEPPFFLYLHYMEPHDPYLLPPDWEPRFTGPVPDGPDRDALLAGDPNPFATRLYEQRDGAGLAAEELRFLVDRYDEDIAYWDHWFGELVAELDRRGRLDDTVVVVASDHGEEFLEHGDLKHCRNVYDTTIKVPLVFMIPGLGPRRLEVPASNLDIVPTVLDLLAVDPRDASFEGESVRRWITGWSGRPRTRVQRSWWGQHRMVSDGALKLVYSARERRLALHRLDVDPGEKVDVLGQNRAAASHLRSSLRQWLDLEPHSRAGGGDELEAQLKALGYLQ
jgi:arylsulfatase A-like enzyme